MTLIGIGMLMISGSLALGTLKTKDGLFVDHHVLTFRWAMLIGGLLVFSGIISMVPTLT